MSVNEKMTAIADAIRGYTGGTDKLSLDAIAAAIPDVFGAGEGKKDSEWRDKVYVDTVSFNDTNGITVSLPFVPDRFCVISYEALAMSTPYTYYLLVFDRASFAQRCAQMGIVGETLSLTSAALNNATRDTYFTVSENSVIFTPPQSSYWKTSLWRKGADYFVFAYRSGKSDRQLLEEEIAALPAGGGSVVFSGKRVFETVSEAEWESIIAPARESGWTFALA